MLIQKSAPGHTGPQLHHREHRVLVLAYACPITARQRYEPGNAFGPEAKEIGIREYLTKPVVMKELTHTVRAALDGKS